MTSLRQRGSSYSCSTSYEDISKQYAELHLLSFYLTSLLCSSVLVIPRWMFHTLRVPSCHGHLLQRRVRTIQSSLTHLYQSQFSNDVFLVIRYHIAVPDDLDHTVLILLQLSTYHIEVLPLKSGKGGTFSGEVSTESHCCTRVFPGPFSEHFPRSRCTQARYTLASPNGSYHVAVHCSFAWGSTTQPILSAEQGMWCGEDKQCT